MIVRFVNDMKKYFSYAKYSARSDLKSEVASSYLNWLWWILDPLLYMLVYSFITVIVFQSKVDYFPIFVFIGLTLWNFFSKNVQGSVKMVRQNSGIVSKVYIPKYILILQKLLVNRLQDDDLLGAGRDHDGSLQGSGDLESPLYDPGLWC